VAELVCTVTAASTGDSFGHCWRRNGELCVAVGPINRTAFTVGCMLV